MFLLFLHLVSDPFTSAAVHADLTLAMIPRSVTMALALPIAHQLHASAGITALGVMLTGTPAFLKLPTELLTKLLTELLTKFLTLLLTLDSQTQAFVH